MKYMLRHGLEKNLESDWLVGCITPSRLPWCDLDPFALVTWCG